MNFVQKFRILSFGLMLVSLSLHASEDPQGSTENCEPPPATVVNLPELISTCIAERRPMQNAVELITQDLRVCDCLEDPQRNPLLQAIPVSPAPVQNKSEVLRRNAETFANTRALQSVSSGLTAREVETNLMTNGTGEVRKAIQVGARTNPTLRNPDVVPQITSKLAQANQIAEERRNNQCVTYMEYSANREIPYDNNFFRFLQTTTEFREDDWKMEPLLARFDQTTDQEVRRVLASRMLFLSRNPQYASFLRAQPIQGISAETVRARKVEFFNILRTLAPAASSTCQQVENQCWRDIQASGAYGRFSASASQFLRRDDVTDLVSAQASSDYVAEVERLSRVEDLKDEIPMTATGYANYLQSTDRDLAFGCSGSSASAECFQRFGQHCQRVRTIHARATNAISGADFVRELRAEEQLHGTLDPQQNMSFESFNDLICLQNYRNAAGEESNFFTFRNRVCPEGNTSADCSDRRTILKRFLDEYNVSDNPGDLNIRTGFASSLERPDFVSVTETQISAINRITERPAELRARFGGGYPTISPQGTLVPFRGNSTPARTNTASNETVTPTASAEVPRVTAGSEAARTEEIPRRRSQEQSNRRDSSDDSEGFTSRDNQVGRRNELPISPRRRLPGPPGTNAIIASPQTESTNMVQRSPAAVAEVVSATPNSPARLATAATVAAPTANAMGGGANNANLGPARNSSDPVVELPRRSRVRRMKGSLNRALLAANENVSDSPVSEYQRQLEALPSVPVTTTPEVIQAIVDDPNSLAENQAVMTVVNGSSDEVVKLSLKGAEGDAPVIIYAQKVNGTVRFGFTPPEPHSPERSPASLGNNEMNVRLQSDLYNTVTANPSLLRNYESVISGAMSLPGDVVRLNILAEGQEPVPVYVDKRGPQPVFTTNDKRIINAYRP